MTKSARASLARWVPPVIATVGVVWAALIYIYFLRVNHALVHNADQPLGIFSGLFGPYRFSLTNTPPLELLQALIVLAMTQALGVLVLKALGVRLNRVAFHALAFPLGFGLSGIAFELLTMARLLYTLPAWLLWGVLLGGAYYASRRRLLAGCAVPGTETQAETEPDDRLFSVPFPVSVPARCYWFAAVGIGALITLIIFWHALFFPESYWDSLILYLGYAHLTFLEHGFPFKAEAQVGIGLGANYPHLYPNYGALASTMFGHWSDLHQRLAAPVAATLATVLVYTAAVELWRSHTAAVSVALLFRSIPNGIAYSTFASDYAFAILFTAAFVHLAILLARRMSPGVLVAFTLIPAIGMHLNYLMGILWVPWLLHVLWCIDLKNPEAGWGRTVALAARCRFLVVVMLAGIALSLPWYIRNTVLTGNPVYSFFPEIFTASVRVNPEVLRSAELEWFRHGDGVGKVAEFVHSIRTGQDRSEADPDFRRMAGLGDRVRASFMFWVGFDALRLRDDGSVRIGSWPWRLYHLLRVFHSEPDRATREAEGVSIVRYRNAWKMQPLFPAFVFPGLLLVLGWGAWRIARGNLRGADHAALAGMTTVLAVFFCLLFYMYFIADFYLYQIIPILVPGALLAGAFFRLVDKTGPARKPLVYTLCVIVLAQGIAPGMAFSLLNFKVHRARNVDGQVFSPFNLDVFRQPGMHPGIFYRLAYGDDPLMWDYLNTRLQGVRLLTHENRHYVLDPSIELVHLDDWDIQQGYDLPDAESIRRFLAEQSIEWYLRVPKESNHTINLRLGMDRLEAAGYLEPVYTVGSEDHERLTLFRLRDEPAVSP